MRPESFPYPGGLLDEDEHLIYAGVHRRVAQENVADNSPGLKLIDGSFPSCDGCNLMPCHEEIFFCKSRDHSPP